jgi:hypothetical protein
VRQLRGEELGVVSASLYPRAGEVVRH